jgi:hypothetical protein
VPTNLDLITLPLRATVLLVLFWLAYYFGYGTPLEEWRRESSDIGVVARYSRNGRPWRIFYDRDLDRKWDMWIDERGGPPLIVSVDDDRDGRPDRDEDEFGNAISAWQSSQFRARKTLVEFLHNAKQLQYLGLAVLLYTLLEFGARSIKRE